MITVAHPEGGTHTECGGKPVSGDGHIETEAEAQKVDIAVAEKDPHGELVARSAKRRELLAQVGVSVTEEKEDVALADAALKALEAGNIEEAKSKIVQLKSRESKEISGPAPLPVAAPMATAASKRRQLVAELETAIEPKVEAKVEPEVKAETKVEVKAEVKTAEVDAEAKKYYKGLYDSDPEAKKFADDLTKDYSATKKASIEADKADRSKMHRAYAVALRQVKLGQIKNTRQAVENQVDNLLGMDDQVFTSFEKAVSATTVPAEKTVKASVQEVKSESAGLVRTAGALKVGQNNQESSITDRLGGLPWSGGAR
jgi:hypothetical protein